jgi:fructosamine-3-kinase
MLHRSSAPRFGWHRDNTIGRTPQSNRLTHEWPAFLSSSGSSRNLRLPSATVPTRRLLAAGHRLCECVPLFFTSYRPVPSLLHGDLWGGNWGTDTTGHRSCSTRPSITATAKRILR